MGKKLKEGTFSFEVVFSELGFWGFGRKELFFYFDVFGGLNDLGRGFLRWGFMGFWDFGV